ncbi:hypothetical protein G7051_00620 [Dysgonomonas sp. HDW5B]|uniref:hypothetical protein n=1 Tax=Dysgonomonas sp. HDW5B TaxID=2714927 RepID=UPI00140C8449|nr:hypothetical protein [Dysgonomonas sp. HDW5B]QIK52928.1 hypothetical protein G7051_00620 [Dysgonomonas sp. HDW5B]
MEEKEIKQIVIILEEQEYVETTPDVSPPPQGKAWKRKSDGVLFYSAVYLGELHFLNGKKLRKSIKEVPEDFELVDIEDPNDLI